MLGEEIAGVHRGNAVTLSVTHSGAGMNIEWQTRGVVASTPEGEKIVYRCASDNRELKFKRLVMAPGIQREGVYKSRVKSTISALIRQPPLAKYRRISTGNDMKTSSTLICLVAFVWLLCGFCDAVSEVDANAHRRFRNRSPSRGYPVEDFLVEDEDAVELNKRQLFDDYGHMRFGKRNRFDDYGHMRFGRNNE